MTGGGSTNSTGAEDVVRHLTEADDEEPRTREDIRAALLADLTFMVCEVMSLPEREAAEVAGRLFWAMRKTWGGRKIRFHVTRVDELRAQARAMNNGKNAAAVCAALGISLSRFYELISGPGKRAGRKNRGIVLRDAA